MKNIPENIKFIPKNQYISIENSFFGCVKLFTEKNLYEEDIKYVRKILARKDLTSQSIRDLEWLGCESCIDFKFYNPYCYFTVIKFFIMVNF